MKTVLAIIGAVALIAIAAFAGLVFVGVRKAGPILEAAHAYADDTIAAVGADWDVDELLARGAPELLQAGTREEFLQVTELGKRAVGSITEAQPAACELTQYLYTSNEGEVAQATCAATAQHERGAVQYQLNLIYRDDAWKLLFFFFNAEVEENAPVVVMVTPEESQIKNAAQISFRAQAIGYMAPTKTEIGAGAQLSSKIDNLTE